MKRLLSLIIAGLMALAIIPTAVFGEDGEPTTVTNLPDAYVGAEYNQKIMSYYAGCFPISNIRISRGSLPDGLELKYEVIEVPSPYDTSFTYIFYITGTPRQGGYVTFYVGFTTMDGEMSYPFNLYVVDEYSDIMYGCVGTELEEIILSADEIDDYSFSDSSDIPKGIELVKETRDGTAVLLIKGTPEKSGDYYLILDVKVNGEKATYTYKLTINEESILLVAGFKGEIYKDELFAYPNAEFATDDTLPKGLSIERTVRQHGDVELNVFKLTGAAEEQGDFEFTLKYSVGEKTILTQKYSVSIGGKVPASAYEGVCVFGEKTSLELFTAKKEGTTFRVYGNVPEGMSFCTQEVNMNYVCKLEGTPAEYMSGMYIFEVEIRTEGKNPTRKLCILYVAESCVEVGDLPVYRPMQFCIGGEFDNLVSVELLIPYEGVTVTKTDNADYPEYLVKFDRPEQGEYILPMLVRCTDSQTGDTAETIVAYRVHIVNYIIGDSNCDGVVNTGDAVNVLKYSAGMTELDLYSVATSDVNEDGNVNTGDAVLILKILVGTTDN